jgi:aminopeptidase-like protein
VILNKLCGAEQAAEQASQGLRLARELFPICRTIAGPTVRETLDVLGTWVDLERNEVPSGTPVFDWEIPPEWRIRDAYVAAPDGTRVIDFKRHNLHVVNFSVPHRARMTLSELQPFLHSDPVHPDWIPYRTSYYKRSWGFCLSHRAREALEDVTYDVVVDSDIEDGALTYGECIVQGQTADVGLVYTHTCHPSLANDNISGMVVAAALARQLASEHPRLTWKFVFGPGTIGSLAWLARNEDSLDRIRCGLTIGLLGDGGPLTYKRTRLGNTTTDRAASLVLTQSGVPHRELNFEPYGYDERQFCSPGFDLAIGRLSRAVHNGYPEYHSSGDDLSLLRADRLAESITVAAQVIGALDENRVFENLSPRGEPRLGKRGLYNLMGGRPPGEFEHALLWVLSYSDGHHDLIDISRRSALPIATIVEAASALENASLLRDTSSPAVQQGALS